MGGWKNDGNEDLSLGLPNPDRIARAHQVGALLAGGLMKFYKVLSADGSPFHGGKGAWSLPHGKRPGKWMPEIKGIVPCERGYHLVSRGQLLKWLGPAIFE